MPKVTPAQSGQVTPGQNGAPALYGQQVTDNTVNFKERCLNLFSPADFVIVKNVDDAPLYWQYQPEENEETSTDGVQRQVYRKEPEMWMIDAGESEVIVGASAMMALDAMYKNVVAKKVLGPILKQSYDDKGKHIPKSFNYSDGGQQDQFLSIACLGKARPVFDGFGNDSKADELDDETAEAAKKVVAGVKQTN